MVPRVGQFFRVEHRLTVVAIVPASTVAQTAQIHGSVSVAHLRFRLHVGKFALAVDEHLRRRDTGPVQAVGVDARVLEVLLRVAHVLEKFQPPREVDVHEVLVQVRHAVVAFRRLHDDVIGAPRVACREEERGGLVRAVHGAQDERVDGSQTPVHPRRVDVSDDDSATPRRVERHKRFDVFRLPGVRLQQGIMGQTHTCSVLIHAL